MVIDRSDVVICNDQLTAGQGDSVTGYAGLSTEIGIGRVAQYTSAVVHMQGSYGAGAGKRLRSILCMHTSSQAMQGQTDNRADEPDTCPFVVYCTPTSYCLRIIGAAATAAGLSVKQKRQSSQILLQLYTSETRAVQWPCDGRVLGYHS